MKSLVFLILLITSTAFSAGSLQNEDFKTEAQLISAGGTKAQLLNDSKIYLTGSAETLDDALGVSIVTTSGTMTLSNKTLLSPSLTTPVITGGSASGITLVNPTVSGGTFTNSTRVGGTTSGGTISNSSISSATITASSYTGGTISGSAVTGGTFSAPAITGGSASGVTITGGSITSSAVSGGSITGASISGSTIVGGSSSGVAITNPTITGGTISGTTISGITMAQNVTVVSNTTTLSTTAQNVLANASATAFTITLPSASSTGTVLSIQKTDTTSNVVTISTAFGQTISGDNAASSTAKLNFFGQSMDLISTGTGWQVLARSNSNGDYTIRIKYAGDTGMTAVCSANPCVTVSSNTPGVVVNTTGTGLYALSIPAGICSVEPTCSVLPRSPVGNSLAYKRPGTTASAVSVPFDSINVAGTATNTLGDVMCSCPR